MHKKSATASSKRWLEEHFSDHFVKRAQREGLRARSVYKLSQIDSEYHLLRSGMRVVDLGAAPGSWSAYVAPKIAPLGKLVAVDLLPMKALANVTFIKGDFTDNSCLDELRRTLNGAALDLVLSDMAPNFSGIKEVDQARVINLMEAVLQFACQTLKPQGKLLLKLFNGEGSADFTAEVKKHFARVVWLKPAASRARSAEGYLLATGFIPHKVVIEG